MTPSIMSYYVAVTDAPSWLRQMSTSHVSQMSRRCAEIHHAIDLS